MSRLQNEFIHQDLRILTKVDEEVIKRAST